MDEILKKNNSYKKIETEKGQQSYLIDIFTENAIKLKTNEKELQESITKFIKIKNSIESCIFSIDEELANEVFKHPENIFPWWYKLKKDYIEYEKDGDLYSRCHEKYQNAMDELLSLISEYVRCPVLKCDLLNSLFLRFFLYLKDRIITNYYGFKILNKTCGWRYNMLGALIGNYGLTLIAGLVTSGFVLYPILFFISLYSKESWIAQSILSLSVILFVYKIARLVFDTVFYRLGFKNSLQKQILPLADLQNYVYKNEVLQPSKLKELADKDKDTPAAISILIKNMINKQDIANNTTIDFFNLYKK